MVCRLLDARGRQGAAIRGEAACLPRRTAPRRPPIDLRTGGGSASEPYVILFLLFDNATSRLCSHRSVPPRSGVQKPQAIASPDLHHCRDDTPRPSLSRMAALGVGVVPFARSRSLSLSLSFLLGFIDTFTWEILFIM